MSLFFIIDNDSYFYDVSTLEKKNSHDVSLPLSLLPHLQWYEEHPEFLLNPLYIAGDSYSGLIVPPLTFQIARGKNYKL
jgi:hypothetical protein